jgi:fibronectin type 3 domain-containing protein
MNLGSYQYNQTFQAILYENGSILFQYNSINLTVGINPAIGIENSAGSDGLAYPINQIMNQSAIWYYYNYAEHDMYAKSISLPVYGQINEYIQVSGTIENLGYSDENNVNVTLKENNIVINWTSGISLPAFSQSPIQFTYKPTTSGNHSIEIDIVPVTGETNTANNARSRSIDVRNWAGKVLYDSANSGIGYWSYLTLVNELKKVNIIMEEVYTGIEVDSNDLVGYDAYIAVYVSYYSGSEISVLQNYVNSGNGMLIISRYFYSAINTLTTPFEITWGELSSGRSGIFNNITQHEITNTLNSVYFNYHRCTLAVQGAAKGLIYDDDKVEQGLKLAISNESGAGRVACFTDPWCFEENYINNNDNKKLGTQLMAWVMGDSKPPTRPKGFKARNGKVGNQVNISWSKNSEIDLAGYFIYRSNVSNPSDWGEPVGKASAGAISYRDRGLIDGTDYYYRLAAVDEVPNISKLTNVAKATPTDIIAPHNPLNFTVKDQGTGKSLKLSWNLNKESDVQMYKIYKSTNVEGPFDSAAYNTTSDVTSFEDTDVIEGQTYYYRLTAIDEVPNESPFTIIKKNTPYDRIAPSRPTGFNVSDPGIGNTLIIKWAPNNEEDMIDYMLERKEKGGKDIEKFYIDVPATSFIDKKLEDGKSYMYRVSARDDSKLIPPNNSPATAWLEGIPTDITPPGKPQNFTIIDESYSTGSEYLQRLNLTWKLGNESDITGYKIYRHKFSFNKLDDEKLIGITGMTDHYFDLNVQEGQKYYYKIIAFDEVPNDSEVSEERWAVPKDVTPPPIPVGFVAESLPEGNAIRLRWDQQFDTDIEGFALFYTMNLSQDFELVKKFNKTEDEFIHSGLIDDRLYHYKLLSYDITPNNSTFTSIRSITPSDIQPPSPPKALRIVPMNVGSQLRLSWRENEEHDVKGYRVYRRSESTPYSMIMAVDKNTVVVIDTFLVNGMTYKYYITAIDEVPNESEGSLEKESIPKDSVDPSPPTQVSIKVSKNKDGIIISWVRSNSSDVEGYRIFRSTDGRNYKKYVEVPFSKDSFTDYDVIPETKYYYQLTSFDGEPNISPRSNPVEITLPKKESTLETGLLINIALIIIVIIIILIIIFAVIFRRKKKQDADEGIIKDEKILEAEKPSEGHSQLPMAQTMPQTITPGMPVMPVSPVSPVTTTGVPTTLLPTRDTLGTGAPVKTMELPKTTIKEPLDTPILPPATFEHEVIKDEVMVPDIEETSVFEEADMEMPPETLEITEQTIIDQPLTTTTATATSPTQPQSVRPIEPVPYTMKPEPTMGVSSQPIEQLPVILVPVDEHEVEQVIKQDKGKRKKKPKTFLNPLLYNVPKVPLNRPPVGKVVKPEPKKKTTKSPTETETPVKTSKTKTKTKKPKEDETSEDDIKNILNQYMK